MTEEKGHFEKGRWVLEPEPVEEESAPGAEDQAPEEEQSAPQVEDLAREASKSVKKAIDDVVVLGRNLFGTKEGREHIEKKARAAGAELERAINEVAEAAKKTIKNR
ncbi:MAG: hypothetical protein PHU26_03910 [Methanofollis liminatans]|uniref:Uncharacterized protein n=1 Tax=Methanofollis liminatans DSM 4140 TaxID=28892 RepID=J1AP02_9EURY|nr:hypothetical protein [Methanofollis liminatans]EJG06638.1 hypothetical protein Metli_0672 [Methanofollis liminatans DSM 4140]MDD3111420.1 hypothetical protein [Methanofollis liminatans]